MDMTDFGASSDFEEITIYSFDIIFALPLFIYLFIHLFTYLFIYVFAFALFYHSHKKRKYSTETQAILLIFLLEHEISGITVQRIHQSSEKR